MRPRSDGASVMRPSDSWAKAHTAPAYSSFPSDIRHTKTRQNLVENNCDVPSLQQSQFEEVQLGMLLGGSSSGNVYRGMWRSIPVAVKVRSCSLWPWRRHVLTSIVPFLLPLLCCYTACVACSSALLPGCTSTSKWCQPLLESQVSERHVTKAASVTRGFSKKVETRLPRPPCRVPGLLYRLVSMTFCREPS